MNQTGLRVPNGRLVNLFVCGILLGDVLMFVDPKVDKNDIEDKFK